MFLHFFAFLLAGSAEFLKMQKGRVEKRGSWRSRSTGRIVARGAQRLTSFTLLTITITHPGYYFIARFIVLPRTRTTERRRRPSSNFPFCISSQLNNKWSIRLTDEFRGTTCTTVASRIISPAIVIPPGWIQSPAVVGWSITLRTTRRAPTRRRVFHMSISRTPRNVEMHGVQILYKDRRLSRRRFSLCCEAKS
jgi:hypothetical protein